LFKQGTVESRQQALEILQTVVERYQQQGQTKAQAQTLQMVGLIRYSLSQYAESAQAYQQALQLFQQLGLRSEMAYLQVSLAMAYLHLSDYPQALSLLEQAQATFRELKDHRALANALNQTGQVYYQQGQTPAAIAALHQALTLQQQLGDKDAQVDTLQSLAIFYINLGQLQEAEKVLNQAQALDPSNQTLVDQIAAILRSRSLPEDIITLEDLEGLLVQFKAAGDRHNTATTLMSIGTIHSSRGRHRQALAAYQEALSLYQAIGLKTGIASALKNIGQENQALGKYQASLEAFTPALALAQSSQNQAEQTGITLSLADIHATLGSYETSLDYYQQALTLAQQSQSRFQEAMALMGLTYLYRLKGDYTPALALAQKAVVIWEQEKQPLSQAAALSNLVRLYEAMGNYPQALAENQRIQAIATQINDPWIGALANGFYGRIYLAMGQPALGLKPAQEAVASLQQSQQNVALAPNLVNLAKIYTGLQQAPQALQTYQQALTLWQQLGDRLGEVSTRYEISRLYRAQGQLQNARQEIEQALAITEDLRNTVKSQDLRQSYFSTVQDYYEFYIDLLMELHQRQPEQGFDRLALEVSERARARSLLELLTEANTDIRRGLDPKLRQQEQQLRTQLQQLEAGRQQVLAGGETGEPLTDLEQQLRQTRQAYQSLLETIRRQNPDYADLTQPRPLTLTEIQAQLDNQTLLLEYYLGTDRSYLWAVSAQGVSSYTLPPKAELEKAVRQFRQFLQHPGKVTTVGYPPASAVQLSQALLGPIQTPFAQKRLVIVADGALQYFPFSALPLPGQKQPLMVEHEVSYLPSASTLAVLRQQARQRSPAPRTLTLFADPVFNAQDERFKVPQKPQTPPTIVAAGLPLARAAQSFGIEWDRLPGTQAEAQAIAALIPETQRRTALGFQATQTEVLQPELSQYRFIHFATHGLANTEKPELSAIVMSLLDEQGHAVDGFLRLQEVYNLNLGADLVVLSACQTGLGQVIRGEGLIGLTRGFMYAGAPRVVTSLWNVDDAGTAVLMTHFYEGILRDNLPPSAALRQAQLKLWQTPQWQSPYYWAAFTLQGEWR
jgi:CHAT domain-containing protein